MFVDKIIAFEIIGLNMWASVGWDPIQFIRQLFWLALEPPPAEYIAERLLISQQTAERKLG